MNVLTVIRIILIGMEYFRITKHICMNKKRNPRNLILLYMYAIDNTIMAR
jgi:branched-subunit amino acid transport protein AzlD